MKVVILCGGLGTRLREETEYRPKPMVNIGNKPILWHIMKIYSHYGLNHFVLCLGYKGYMIKDYFLHYEVLNNDFTIELGKQQQIELHNHHTEKDWRITLADTGEKTLKGARLKCIQKYIDSDQFMVTYGDGVADIDMNDLLAFHNRHGKIATMTGVSPTSRFGEMKIQGNQVEGFFEKPKDNYSIVNGGFFVFQKEIVDYLTEEESCDLEIGALEELANAGQLMVYKHTGFWACMDTHRDVVYLNTLWEESNAAWKVWK